MPFRYFSPGATIFSLVAAGVMSLFSRSKKSSSTASFSPSSTTSYQSKVEEENVSAMQEIVSQHKDCTAEVIDINIFGRRRVETFRLLSIGQKIDIRMKKGDLKVFAYGEYIAELIPSAGSNLEQLFKEHIQVDAFLGGRNYTLHDDTYDTASIILFYKLDGVPPTKVDLL